jgi:hypothetical protein
MQLANEPSHEFNQDKFQALVHYICYKAHREDLGATKLNKILWYADVWSYISRGAPMTGETYVKQDFGPVPLHILDTISQLSNSGKLCVRDVDYYNRNKKEYIALTRPDFLYLSSEEISIMDELIDAICRKHTAKSISDITHDETWKLAAIGEPIPLHTAFIGKRQKPTEEDIDWAHQLLAEEIAE